jgi:CBS-domain-containing membrane protein
MNPQPSPTSSLMTVMNTGKSPNPINANQHIFNSPAITTKRLNSGHLGEASHKPSSPLFTRTNSLAAHNKYFDLNNGLQNTIENNEIFSYFMKHKFCYDIMPKSAKVVVFDTQLLVKKAFFALIYNGVRAAPLWDSKLQKFVGMLTITDFILILQKYYRTPNAKIEELEEHKLETWREVLKEYNRPFIYLKPDDTLYEAVRVLAKDRVHRLPIIDPHTGNVLCIVTHKRILRYLYLFIYDMPQPEYLQKSIGELNIGIYDNIRTIQTTTSISEALNIFVATRVSSLPVVDAQQKLVNIYSKFDVIDLAAEKTYNNLDVSVTEALEYRRNRFDGVASCTKHETLSTIMERIVNKEVHRLVVIDDESRVLGIVSLSDILRYIVLKCEKPPSQSTSSTPPPPPYESHDSSSFNSSLNSSAKTASLTQAFGLTRLSTSHDHIILNEANQSNNNSTINQQPQMTTIDNGTIFEDDPMETELPRVKLSS